MKRRTKVWLLVISLLATVFVSLSFNGVRAESAACERTELLCLKPLVMKPLDDIRSVKTPELAIPVWLTTGVSG